MMARVGVLCGSAAGDVIEAGTLILGVDVALTV